MRTFSDVDEAVGRYRRKQGGIGGSGEVMEAARRYRRKQGGIGGRGEL